MRHERIVLVVLGYVIGFVTAYIAFAVPDDYTKSYKKVDSTSVEDTSTQADSAPATDAFEIEINDVGMFVENGSKKAVISATLQNGTVPGPGFHVEVPQHELSPNNKFVYFCAQLTLEEQFCHHYLYLIDEHIIKPLRTDGVVLTSTAIDSEFHWTPDGTLTAENLKSVSSETPWELDDM